MAFPRPLGRPAEASVSFAAEPPNSADLSGRGVERAGCERGSVKSELFQSFLNCGVFMFVNHVLFFLGGGACAVQRKLEEINKERTGVRVGRKQGHWDAFGFVSFESTVGVRGL